MLNMSFESSLGMWVGIRGLSPLHCGEGERQQGETSNAQHRTSNAERQNRAAAISMFSVRCWLFDVVFGKFGMRALAERGSVTRTSLGMWVGIRALSPHPSPLPMGEGEELSRLMVLNRYDAIAIDEYYPLTPAQGLPKPATRQFPQKSCALRATWSLKGARVNHSAPSGCFRRLDIDRSPTDSNWNLTRGSRF
jgi:hypothetical protein